MFVLLRIRSLVTFPCIWQVPPESYILNDCAVPDADALADHVPAIVVAPADEVRKELGRLMVTSVPVGSAAAQFAGSAPLKILRFAPVPMVA
jgi:hypothetical protein